jgi:ABC-2 type transport system ATP-binding protein
MSEPAVAALKVRNLTKSFGGASVVKNLSLEVQPGEIFGLLGPNGAGKSTTINLITGVCRMESGAVEVFGHDNVRDYRTTRRLVGVVHQEIVIDPYFTVGEALRLQSGYFGVEDSWRETLLDRLALRPHLNKKMNRLSGGMKRRFMIAKALVHRPQLLILDEPTAGVDVELRKGLWEFVREIRKDGTTILLTTHYLEEAEVMCDRIAIMNDGALVALDTTRNLMGRLDKRTLKVRLGQPTQLTEAITRRAPRISEDGRSLEFHLARSEESAEVLKELMSSGAPVTDVETKDASLEDVFLKITSRKLDASR